MEALKSLLYRVNLDLRYIDKFQAEKDLCTTEGGIGIFGFAVLAIF